MPRIRNSLRIVFGGAEWVDMRKSGVVKRALPVPGSDDRVVLLHWGVSMEAQLRNIVRVDRHGNVVWKAELPGGATHDCFVSLESDGAGFVATTYSGRSARFDASGRSEQPRLLAAVV